MRYVIQQGDTLSALAKKHNTSVDRLAADNGIKDVDKIYAGRILLVPDSPQPGWNLLEAIRKIIGW